MVHVSPFRTASRASGAVYILNQHAWLFQEIETAHLYSEMRKESSEYITPGRTDSCKWKHPQVKSMRYSNIVKWHTKAIYIFNDTYYPQQANEELEDSAQHMLTHIQLVMLQ